VVPREGDSEENYSEKEVEEPAMLPYLDICNHSDEGQAIGWYAFHRFDMKASQPRNAVFLEVSVTVGCLFFNLPSVLACLGIYVINDLDETASPQRRMQLG